jgi:hypothetical protein
MYTPASDTSRKALFGEIAIWDLIVGSKRPYKLFASFPVVLPNDKLTTYTQYYCPGGPLHRSTSNPGSHLQFSTSFVPVTIRCSRFQHSNTIVSITLSLVTHTPVNGNQADPSPTCAPSAEASAYSPVISRVSCPAISQSSGILPLHIACHFRRSRNNLAGIH